MTTQYIYLIGVFQDKKFGRMYFIELMIKCKGYIVMIIILTYFTEKKINNFFKLLSYLYKINILYINCKYIA